MRNESRGEEAATKPRWLSRVGTRSPRFVTAGAFPVASLLARRWESNQTVKRRCGWRTTRGRAQAYLLDTGKVLVRLGYEDPVTAWKLPGERGGDVQLEDLLDSLAGRHQCTDAIAQRDDHVAIHLESSLV